MALDGTVALSSARSMLRMLFSILSAPLWFFDAVDKEAFVTSIPLKLRRRILQVMFYPTLFWTILLHRMMPEQRRWYDRIDSRVIIGALPLKTDLPTLARVFRRRVAPLRLRARRPHGAGRSISVAARPTGRCRPGR